MLPKLQCFQQQLIIRRIGLIWHLATSDCSSIWKCSWKITLLRWSKRFKKIIGSTPGCLWNYLPEKFASCGKRSGTSALQCRGTNLVVTIISGLNFHLAYFMEGGMCWKLFDCTLYTLAGCGGSAPEPMLLEYSIHNHFKIFLTSDV